MRKAAHLSIEPASTRVRWGLKITALLLLPFTAASAQDTAVQARAEEQVPEAQANAVETFGFESGGATAEEINRFGFEDELDAEGEQRREQYRQTQRRFGIESAGKGVDVEAGYEATGDRSIRR